MHSDLYSLYNSNVAGYITRNGVLGESDDGAVTIVTKYR